MLLCLKEILYLLKTGSTINQPKKNAFFYFKFIILFVIFKLFLVLLVNSILSLVNYIPSENLSLNKVNELSIIKQIIVISIIAPIIEELTYRLSLKYSKLNISITFSMIIYIIAYPFLKELNSELLLISIGLLIIAISFFFLFLLLENKQKINNHLFYFFKNNKIFIFYFSAILFSYRHIHNYEFTYENIFFYIIILPHMLASIFYSYLRLKKGIIASILFHSLNNSLYFLTLILY